MLKILTVTAELVFQLKRTNLTFMKCFLLLNYRVSDAHADGVNTLKNTANLCSTLLHTSTIVHHPSTSSHASLFDIRITLFLPTKFP